MKMIEKIRGVVALGLIALLALSFSPVALASDLDEAEPGIEAKAVKYLYVKYDTKLFKSAKTSADAIAELARGDKLERVSIKGNWGKVRFNGQTGYVLKSMLSSSKPAPTTSMYVKSNGYVYKSNKTSSKKLVKAAAGDQVRQISTKGGWAKVIKGSKTGYMQTSKLSATKPSSSTPEPSTQSEPDEYTTLQTGDKGDEVKKLQTRLKALGWFNGTIGGNYLTLTAQAVTDFQEAAKLEATGVADVKTQKALYASNAPRFEITGVSTATPATGEVHEMDWWTSNISTLFARGSTAVVTDVRTGISFRVYRGGGTNHADVQPLTANDTAAMKRAFGGSWSWDRRAIWVSIGGKRYAASMNGMPHGSGSIAGNNFDGHFCIHFTNSRTHGTNRLCPLHQAAIQVALAAG